MRKLLSIVVVLFLAGCSSPPATESKEGSGHVVLKPLPDAAKYVPKVRQLVYVPVYAGIYSGIDQQMAQLAVTLSIRNVNAQDSIVIHSTKYFDSDGKPIREFVATPSELGPLVSADFVIQRRDSSGGPGANFLVEWSSATDVDEPVIEAVMIGQHANAGISFSVVGRPLPKASAKLPTH